MMAFGSVLPPAKATPPPPPPPGEVVEVGEDAGMSDALTSTAPPCDSRNAITDQTCAGDSCFVITGMIGWEPDTTNAVGLSSDSYRYCLQVLPGSRLPQRAPIGPWPFSSVRRFGARSPSPWQVVQPPIPVYTFSPAATSCSGVTLAPRVSACGTSDWTCGILLAMRV